MIAADFLLAGIVIALGGAFWLERSFTPPALLKMILVVVAGHALSFTYRPRAPDRRWAMIGALALGSLFAGILYWLLRGQMVHVVSRPTFAAMLLVFAPLQAGFHIYYRRPRLADAFLPGVEYLRWMVVAGAALVLHRPLLTTGSIGAGDAYWYTIMVADFISQWREGIFPVFVGQTEFAFNGAISPLRFAPGLQHLAGFIDLATLHSLPFHGILNLTLLVCYVAGALTCYGCLRAIEPRAAWLAVVLAWLFSASPGVLALAYVGNLFMSVTAVPWVPVLLYGAWRTLKIGDRKGVLIMVAAAAALWYFHPPIAFWGTIIAALTQIVRLPKDGGTKRTWLNWLVGLAAFGALSLYCFVSVSTTGIASHPTNRGKIIHDLKETFPASLAPVSNNLASLGDFQLGWTLWGVLAAGVVGLLVLRPRRPAFAFLAAVVLLFTFLVPVPRLLDFLWLSVPQAICDITYMWPMQRLYLLLAGLVVFLAFATLGPFAGRHRWVGGFMLIALLGGARWSAEEVGKFHFQAMRSTTGPKPARQELLPQNHILTRYSFNPFHTIPSYISHGFIDPLVPNRLLSTDSLTELASNSQTLESDPNLGTLRAEGSLVTSRPDPAQPTLAIEQKLRLEPGRHYVLRLDFAHPEFTGALRIFGPRTVRSYWLPDSAYDTKPIRPARSFAALSGRPHSITLWTDGDEPEELAMMFFFTASPPEFEVKTFGTFTLREFDPTQLPVLLENWTPYRARVRPSAAGYLETPRMFIDGYRASVDGRPVAVTRSPDSLVMVPVTPGDHRVEVFYRGPWSLRAAYFLSMAAWVTLVAIWLRARWRGVSANPTA